MQPEHNHSPHHRRRHRLQHAPPATNARGWGPFWEFFSVGNLIEQLEEWRYLCYVVGDVKSWGDYCVYLSFWKKVAASFWRVEDVVVCVADHRWLRHVANSLLWNGFLCGENSILCGWSAPNLETFKT